jgi:hypothetical protein
MRDDRVDIAEIGFDLAVRFDVAQSTEGIRPGVNVEMKESIRREWALIPIQRVIDVWNQSNQPSYVARAGRKMLRFPRRLWILKPVAGRGPPERTVLRNQRNPPILPAADDVITGIAAAYP